MKLEMAEMEGRQGRRAVRRMKMSEKEVFEQKVSDEELEAVAGGDGDSDDNCSNEFRRDIYAGGFPNCAATVEHNSWCDTNDACFNDAVCYYDMKECTKCWQ